MNGNGSPITAKTGISLGLVVTVIVGGVWWAASMTTKLDSVLEKMSDVEARLRSLERKTP